MKPVSEWDEEYVLSLSVGENDWLEAKVTATPDLTGSPSYFMIPGVGKREPSYKEKATLSVKARNTGNVLAQYVSIFVALPSEILTKSSKRQGNRQEIDGMSYHLLDFQNTVREVVDVKFVGIGPAIKKFGPTHYEPIKF